MRDFSVSAISFAIVAFILWGGLLVLAEVISFLATLGLPTAVSWFVAGFATALSKPFSAVTRLSSGVYERVHGIIWRY